MMTFSQKAHLILDTYDLSTRKMGKLCDLSHSTISRLKHPEYSPSQSTIYHFSKGTKIPPNWLTDDRISFDESDIREKMNASSEEGAGKELPDSLSTDDPVIRKVISLMSHLDTAQKEALVNVASLFVRDNESISGNKTGDKS